MKEDETMSSQERGQGKTQLVNEAVEGEKVDGGSLMRCLDVTYPLWKK